MHKAKTLQAWKEALDLHGVLIAVGLTEGKYSSHYTRADIQRGDQRDPPGNIVSKQQSVPVGELGEPEDVLLIS